MERTYASEIGLKEGNKTVLMGWVGARRDHGKIIFIDIRDQRGIAQLVFLSKEKELFEKASHLRPEWVIKVSGVVNKRPENLVNLELTSGKWEMLVSDLEILNQSETPPIAVDTDGYEIGEESRLKYRYLDLRRPRLQKNITARHEVVSFIRDYLNEKDFIEIETPVISKANTETGARNYLIPSRIYPGKFYALAQSPQQYKQLLMVSGFERYFQIAKCFRDEDTRGDRQQEFTQLDLEMSFVEKEDIMNLTENLYVKIIQDLFPDKKISQTPFPQFTYAEVMKKYETDKPDLRKNKNDANELAFAWITDFPFFEPVRPGSGQETKWTFTHNPFSAPKKEHMEWLIKKTNISEIKTEQYDLVLNGHEIGGGSIRNHKPEALRAVLEIMGMSEEKITNSFGHMISALSYGAPPHGGIAPGIDRFLMILMNEPNIREVIAFPKTGDGQDLMMESPSEISKDQLEDLRLEIKRKGK
ncbi:MAG: amino acid--tRNA ligase-related protein [Patescibacteria group bacterium]|mgnify:CR=1 FL=1